MSGNFFCKNEEIYFFAVLVSWWRVVEVENGGGFSFLVEGGGDSPFFVEKCLENQGFSVKKILRKWAFWGCFFITAVLPCG